MHLSSNSIIVLAVHSSLVAPEHQVRVLGVLGALVLNSSMSVQPVMLPSKLVSRSTTFKKVVHSGMKCLA